MYLGSVEAMAYGLVVGALLSFALLISVSQIRLKFKFITHDHILLLVEGLAIAYIGFIENIWIKLPLYIVLVGVYIAGTYIARFYNKEDFQFVLRKLSVLKRF